MRNLFRIILILVIGITSFSSFAAPALAQNEEVAFESTYASGKVIDISEDENGLILYKTQLKDGSVIYVNTYGEKVEVGSRVYLEYFSNTDMYNFITVNRNMPLVFLFIFFIGTILLLSRKKGVRSLVSLGLSLGLLLLVLVPILLSGVDPIWVTVPFGLCVLFLSIFVTHGFNYQSLVSFLGSFASILLAVLLIFIINKFSSLTGLISDEIQFLSFEVENAINLVRIVSASIIIGILGVLDDITITQVAVVRELSSDSALDKKSIFVKALRVGRDHIASLVNTLVFAYVGATLPMIMFISLLEIPMYILVSQEFIFIEIIRSLIGAIALTLAVPLTTWLASHVFLKAIHRDSCTLDSACAHHHH